MNLNLDAPVYRLIDRVSIPIRDLMNLNPQIPGIATPIAAGFNPY